MITDQHKFVMKLIGPKIKDDYKLHMCGVCHSLGSHYGLPARILTSHELVLVSILTGAQSGPTAPKVIQRCPVNLLARRPGINHPGADFAASLGIILAYLKIMDDLVDNPSSLAWQNVGKRLLNSSFNQALNQVEQIGLPREAIFTFQQKQIELEGQSSPEAFVPTALLTQKIFEVTSGISGNDVYREQVGEIGYLYGKYIYLMDAFRDFPNDMLQGAFNPLKRYSYQNGLLFGLNQAGIEWLNQSFVFIRNTIDNLVNRIPFQSNKDLLTHLLIYPLNQVLQALQKYNGTSHSFTFKQLTAADAVKAGLLILPVVALSNLADPSLPAMRDLSQPCQQAVETVRGSMDVTATQIQTSGFNLGNIDWIADLLSDKIGDGPCTKICNSDLCAGSCQYCNPSGCCDGGQKSFWNDCGGGCLNVCEGLF